MAKRLSDRKIAAEVRAALYQEPRLHPEGIRVQAKDGVVTLIGRVGRYLDKMLAAEKASRTPGVSEVRNQLQVQPDRPRNPLEIATEISDALAGDKRMDLRGIVVEVAEGIVRLSGTVVSDAERRAAEEHAWQAEGVVEVSNEITLSPDRRRPDREIERDVRTALDEDAQLSDPSRVTARCVAGTLRLEGEVASSEERQSAEQDAWYTAGVVYVENLLKIAGERKSRAVA